MICYTTRCQPATSYYTNKPAHDLPIVFSHTEDAYVLRVSVPGVKKEDIQLKVEDGELTLAAESHLALEDETVHHNEWQTGKFERTLQLPKDAGTDEVTAQVEDGVLTVRMKREHKTQRIPIH